MYCTKCGTKIPEGGLFCPACGTKAAFAAEASGPSAGSPNTAGQYASLYKDPASTQVKKTDGLPLAASYIALVGALLTLIYFCAVLQHTTVWSFIDTMLFLSIGVLTFMAFGGKTKSNVPYCIFSVTILFQLAYNIFAYDLSYAFKPLPLIFSYLLPIAAVVFAFLAVTGSDDKKSGRLSPDISGILSFAFFAVIAVYFIISPFIGHYYTGSVRFLIFINNFAYALLCLCLGYLAVYTGVSKCAVPAGCAASDSDEPSSCCCGSTDPTDAPAESSEEKSSEPESAENNSDNEN